jgi:DNA modification methylase
VFTAIKEAKRILEAEAAAAAVKIGQIVVRVDYKQGDARQLIKTVPDQSVDFIFSDFPFAIPDLADSSSEAQQYTGLMKHSDNLSKDEVDVLVRDLSLDLYRVLKPGSYMAIFFGWDCKFFMQHYFRYVGFEVDEEPIIWDKQSTTGSFKGYSPAPCYEQIMWCIKPPRTKRMSEPMKKIVSCPVVKKDIRTHVFEKPVELLNQFIKRVTNTGDVVLDPCAGTASVLRAAIELQRTAIGFEVDPQHYAIGCKNIFELEQRLQGKTV